MPLNFCHAWRTAAARERRSAELERVGLSTWTADNICEKVGPVPGAILSGVKRGLVKACINFDGEHVDLAISTRTVELLGAENFMMMTDRIQSRRLAGQVLSRRTDSSLLYQEKGIVAGGSQTPAQQVQNLRLWGMPEHDLRLIAFQNAFELLQLGAQPVHANEPLPRVMGE
jgi:N-acetylglucosamine-6-phosphate deacetylase